ncbi:MAG: hypothetical protein IJK08_10385 [Prevotella sp.]|nr:hypothetical protein [Prevotella sp.]
MKKNKFFQNKKKDITAFMVSTLVVLGVGYFCAKDQIKTSSLCYHSTITAQVDQIQKGMETNTAHLKEVQNAMKQLEKIDGKKVKLEKKMEKLSAQLNKAKNRRNKDYGMVPGMGYSAPQGLSEVLCLEHKMKSIDSQIGSLKKAEMEITAKYGKDIKEMGYSLLAQGN